MIRFCECCKGDSEFSLDVPYGVQPWCDECCKDWFFMRDKSKQLKSDQKGLVLEVQGGVCAFCYEDTTEAKGLEYGGDSLVYGILCSQCFYLHKQLRGNLGEFKQLENLLGKIHSLQENVTVKDRKWLALCIDNAKRFSTCAKAQHFAAIVTADGHQVSEGWNGVPSGEIHCSMGGCSRAADPVASNSSYSNCLAQHAEMNAILRAAPEELKGATIYVSGTPCHECVRAIIHSSIRRAVFVRQDKYDPDGATSQLGKHGISVPSFADFEKEKEMLGAALRKRYRHATTTDLDLVKNIVSNLQFNMMMDRVHTCLQEK